MTVDGADFAGHIEPRDRFLHWIEHPLLHIVLRAALCIVDDRPGFHAIERRSRDWHHRFWRPLVVAIGPLTTEAVPALDACLENFRIDVDLPGDLLDAVAF